MRDDGTTIPGLVVRTDGFALGEVLLCYSPSGQCPNNSKPLTKTDSDAKIRLGDILELDDIQIGITDFAVTFGVGVDFNGDIFVATSGGKLFPKAVITASVKNLRAGLSFET